MQVIEGALAKRHGSSAPVPVMEAYAHFPLDRQAIPCSKPTVPCSKPTIADLRVHTRRVPALGRMRASGGASIRGPGRRVSPPVPRADGRAAGPLFTRR